MRLIKRIMLSFLMSASVLPTAASAQGFDPRVPLAQIVQAFQICGPPAVYQMLSPQLFQIVAAQTGGRGCYVDIAAAGAITGMQVIDQREFPVGPVYAIRVTHQSGASADWFVGFNRSTGRIEMLTYQNVFAQNPLPSVLNGPTNPLGGSTNPGNRQPIDPKPPAPDTSKQSQGCNLYPDMCK